MYVCMCTVHVVLCECTYVYPNHAHTLSVFAIIGLMRDDGEEWVTRFGKICLHMVVYNLTEMYIRSGNVTVPTGNAPVVTGHHSCE